MPDSKTVVKSGSEKIYFSGSDKKIAPVLSVPWRFTEE